MARPRTFNEADILSKAMHVFWKKGYAATSISDLEEETGLKRTSLYAAFGDKQGLYLRCLETYAQMGQKSSEQLHHSSENPIDDLNDWFKTLILQGLNDSDRKGCFFNNACSERGNRCPQTQSILSDNRDRTLELFQSKLAEAQELGLLKGDANLTSLSNFLFSLQSGLMINLKNGASKDELLAALDTGMQCLRN